jgi:hypothetical protein
LVMPVPARIAKPARVPRGGAWAKPGEIDAAIVTPSIANVAISREEYRLSIKGLKSSAAVAVMN